MKTTQKEYRAEAILNSGRSTQVLTMLAESGLTMHDGTHLHRIARIFMTNADNIRKNAERNHVVLQLIKDKNEEIERLKRELLQIKSKISRGELNAVGLQPWEMTTEQFRAEMKAIDWDDKTERVGNYKPTIEDRLSIKK